MLLKFENLCHTDDLTIGNQNLVITHIFKRDHHGILTGSLITDIKVTLLTGRADNKHTSGGDFREATFRTLRQGLEKAKNVFLEPYYSFRIAKELEEEGIKGCNNKHIGDKVLYQAFIDTFNIMIENKDYFMEKWK